jgi:hypothetical protein
MLKKIIITMVCLAVFGLLFLVSANYSSNEFADLWGDTPLRQSIPSRQITTQAPAPKPADTKPIPVVSPLRPREISPPVTKPIEVKAPAVVAKPKPKVSLRNSDGYRPFIPGGPRSVDDTPEDKVLAALPERFCQSATDAWNSGVRKTGKVVKGDRFVVMTNKNLGSGQIEASSKYEIRSGEYSAEFRGTFTYNGKYYVVGRIDICHNIFIMEIPPPPPVVAPPPAVSPPVESPKCDPSPVCEPAPTCPPPAPPVTRSLPPVQEPPAQVTPPLIKPEPEPEAAADDLEAFGWGAYYKGRGQKSSDTSTWGASLLYRKEVAKVNEYSLKVGPIGTYQGSMGTSDPNFVWHVDAGLAGATAKLESEEKNFTAHLQVGYQKMHGTDGKYTFVQTDLVIKPELLVDNKARRVAGKKYFPKYEVSATALIGIAELTNTASYKNKPEPRSHTNVAYVDLDAKVGIVDIELSKTLFITPYVNAGVYHDFGQQQYGAQVGVGSWVTWHDRQILGVQAGLDHRFGGGNALQLISGYVHASDLYHAVQAHLTIDASAEE